MATPELKTAYDRWITKDRSIRGFQKLANSLQRDPLRLQALHQLTHNKTLTKSASFLTSISPLVLYAELVAAGLPRMPKRKEARNLRWYLHLSSPYLLDAIVDPKHAHIPKLAKRIRATLSNPAFQNLFGNEVKAYCEKHLAALSKEIDANYEAELKAVKKLKETSAEQKRALQKDRKTVLQFLGATDFNSSSRTFPFLHPKRDGKTKA